MSLIFRIECEFPRPPQYVRFRREFRELKTEAGKELRRLANELRKELRGSAPAKTRKLSRSLRVKRAKGGRDAIVYEIFTPVFYAASTNARGRSKGWWTGVEETFIDEIEGAIADIQARAWNLVTLDRVFQAAQRAKTRAALAAPLLADAKLRRRGGSRRRRGVRLTALGVLGAFETGYAVGNLIIDLVLPTGEERTHQ